MSYFITGTSLLTEYFNIDSAAGLTDITPKNIGSRPVTIASVTATETAGGTPALTIIAYDPRTPASYYRRNAKAFAAAKATESDVEPFVLNNGWKLQALIASGTATIMVNYFNPNASGVAS